jgi:hypothetical protein
MYKVIVRFADIQDSYTVYNPGDIYPREGLKVSAERLAELTSANNKRGVPVIVFVKDYTPTEPSISPKKVEKPEEAEIPEDFMNKPETGKKTPTEAKKPIKRGRRKKDA